MNANAHTHTRTRGRTTANNTNQFDALNMRNNAHCTYPFKVSILSITSEKLNRQVNVHLYIHSVNWILPSFFYEWWSVAVAADFAFSLVKFIENKLNWIESTWRIYKYVNGQIAEWCKGNEVLSFIWIVFVCALSCISIPLQMMQMRFFFCHSASRQRNKHNWFTIYIFNCDFFQNAKKVREKKNWNKKIII